ncbi:MAG: DUF3570 domain-containing protein [Myxococcales bacterium]|nr:DUF3570 domain-containing protein [Myxococcales bacterium]
MVIGSTARAEPTDPASATASFRVYADDDHVTVVSPGARVNVWLGTRTTLAVDTTVDAVTGASVDVISSASPATVHERRLELGTTVTRLLPIGAATSVALGGRVSHEHDYDSVRGFASGRVELAERNTTLVLRYVAGHDVAHAVGDPAFRRTRDSHEVIATWSQLVDPRMVVDLIVDGAWLVGYHASPYRQVRITVPASPLPILVDEVTPARRANLAVAGRVRRALGEHTFATATYRLHVDDWSMTSHTATLELFRQVTSGWLVGLLGRGYWQEEASFYRARYGDNGGRVPELRTSDRTLDRCRARMSRRRQTSRFVPTGTWCWRWAWWGRGSPSSPLSASDAR